MLCASYPAGQGRHGTCSIIYLHQSDEGVSGPPIWLSTVLRHLQAASGAGRNHSAVPCKGSMMSEQTRRMMDGRGGCWSGPRRRRGATEKNLERPEAAEAVTLEGAAGRLGCWAPRAADERGPQVATAPKPRHASTTCMPYMYSSCVHVGWEGQESAVGRDGGAPAGDDGEAKRNQTWSSWWCGSTTCVCCIVV